MSGAFYGEDLAHAHHHGFTTVAEQAADRLMEELGKAKNTNGVIVELGCGSGVTAARLLTAKYQVVGIDVSEAMVAAASANAPRGEFHVTSWADFEIPPCDAVIAINEVLNYATESGSITKSLERLFARVFKALWPGGVFLFDMAGPGRVPDGGPITTTQVGDDWATITTTTEDKRGTLKREIATMRKVAHGIRVSEETHVQRLIASTKVQEMLRKTGFRVRVAQAYEGERAFPGHSVFIARRP